MDALQSGVPRNVNLGAVQNDDGRPDRSAFDFLELPGGFSDVALDESHAVYAGRVARGALRVCAREGQTGMGEEGLVARRFAQEKAAAPGCDAAALLWRKTFGEASGAPLTEAPQARRLVAVPLRHDAPDCACPTARRRTRSAGPSWPSG